MLVKTLIFFVCLYGSTASAWMNNPPTNARRTSFCERSSHLAMTSSNEDESSSSEPIEGSRERVNISGVSVSKKGFHLLLDTTKGTLPIPITRDPQDAYSATSPESLTVIQLLSGVDMAGAILPPETLAKMAIYSCEFFPEFLASPTQVALLEFIQNALKDREASSFSEAHPWIQSRIRLPQVTLDQLTLVFNADDQSWQCELDCALKDMGNLNVVASPEIVKPVCYNYDDDASILFTCLSLALRYKAPIAIANLDEIDVPIDLDKDFPQRTTVAKLQQKSTRVTQNIERGFEIHKLQGALQIAMKRGDQGAVERIRAKLDEYDSMDDLPTTAEEVKKEDTAEENEQEQLDDLDKNILQ